MAASLVASLQGPLQKQFLQFHENREKILAIYNNTEKKWVGRMDPALQQRWRTFSEVRSVPHMNGDTSGERFAEKKFLDRMPAVRKLIEENPKILIIGQIKSGKSSLGNLILGKKLFPTDESPCTGRMVILKKPAVAKRDSSSGDQELKPRLRLKTIDGTVVDEIELEVTQDGRLSLPREYVNPGTTTVLDREQAFRDKDDSSTSHGAWVELTIPDPLLDYFEIIDSPGLDENSALDQLVDETICNGLVHSLIYVVDGSEGLTPKDQRSLEKIRTSAVNNNSILFVCTKVDKASLAETNDPVVIPSMDDDTSEGPDFEIFDENPDEVDRQDQQPAITARYKFSDPDRFQKRVFASLVDAGLLNGYSRWDNCPYFHGVSAYRVEEARRTATEDSNNSFMTAYQKFETSMAHFVADSLAFHTKLALEQLVSKQVNLIEMLFEVRFALARTAFKTPMKVEFAIKAEEQVYQKLKAIVAKEQLPKLTAIIEDEKAKALEALPQQAAQVVVDHFPLNRDSTKPVRDDVTVAHVVQEFITNRFNEKIQERILQQLPVLAISSTIEGCISDLDDQTELARNVNAILKAAYAPVASMLCLRQGLPTRLTISRAFDTIFSRSKSPSEAYDQTWKKTVAKEFLRSLRPKCLAQDYCTTVEKIIDDAHLGFLNDLETLKDRARIIAEDAQAEQSEVRVKDGYELAAVYLDARSLLDTITTPTPQKGTKIGEGNSSSVYSCAGGSWGSSSNAVIKVRSPWPPPQSKKIWPVCLYLSRELLPSDRIQRAVGFIFPSVDPAKKLDPAKELWVIEDRVDCSLENVLCGSVYVEQGTWLQIAIDVASGIWQLYRQGIPHHNIKPSNVLLDSSHRARLSDIGMLDLAALRINPLSRPAFFVSPELTDDDAVNSAVSSEADVYSLGVLLWYLIQGRCSQLSMSVNIRDPKTYQDLHLQTSTTDFFYRVKHGHLRPEVERWMKMGGVHEKAATLMTHCWTPDPHDRLFCGELKISCDTLKNEFDVAS